MPASFPSSVKAFTTKSDGAGNTILSAHINDLQAEVFAIENCLLGNTVLNAVIGGTLGVTGATTLGSTLGVTGAATVGGTLGVTGASTLAALSATTGTFSGVVQRNAAAGNANLVINANAGGAVAARVEHAKSGTVEWLSGFGAFSGGTDYEIATLTTGAGVKMGITTGGVVTITALASGNLTSVSGVITSSSDERLKNITGPLDYGLSEVLRLCPIRYRWTDASGIPNDQEHGGFGAAAVEAVMPLAVATGPDGMRGLSDRPILGALVNAVQTLYARVVDLEQRLADRA